MRGKKIKSLLSPALKEWSSETERTLHDESVICLEKTLAYQSCWRLDGSGKQMSDNVWLSSTCFSASEWSTKTAEVNTFQTLQPQRLDLVSVRTRNSFGVWRSKEWSRVKTTEKRESPDLLEPKPRSRRVFIKPRVSLRKQRGNIDHYYCRSVRVDRSGVPTAALCPDRENAGLPAVSRGRGDEVTHTQKQYQYKKQPWSESYWENKRD